MWVNGDGGDNSIEIAETVDQNNVKWLTVYEGTQVSYREDLVLSIKCDGKAGDDDIEIDLSVPASIAVTLVGGPGDDTLIGGAGNDYLSGEDGAWDVLCGRAGADTLSGGDGDDDLVTYYLQNYDQRTGNLTIRIDGAANDGESGEHDYLMTDVEQIQGGNGNDYIKGSNIHMETLWGGGGNDTLDGGLMQDELDGEDGFDIADYSSRTAAVKVTLQDDDDNDGTWDDEADWVKNCEAVIGGSGNDWIEGNDYDNRLEGRGGNDTIITHQGNDTVYGGNGSDSITASIGNDLIYGDNDTDPSDPYGGADTIYSGDGDDIIYAGYGWNYVEGGSGNDLIAAGYGNDNLLGGSGNDTISGGNGDDTIWGEAGFDSLWGGAGNDLFRTEKDGSTDTVNGDSGSDSIYGSDSFDVLSNLEVVI